jgi:hypothetical protein
MIHVDPALVASDPPPAPARALIEGQMAMLSRLAAIGMEIAEACGREAKAAPNAGEARAVGLVFARVARAVRMTIALQSRLMKDLAALDRADDMAERARTARRRIRLSRLVEDAARTAVAAKRAAGHQYWADEDAVEDEIEQLSCEAYERLVDAEDDDLSGGPFEEVVAGIAKDLGLSPDWTARLLAATAPPASSGAAPTDAPRTASRSGSSTDEPPDPEPSPPALAWARPTARPRPPP